MLLVAAFSLSPKLASACSCLPLGDDFFETVNEHNERVETGRYPQSQALTIVTAEVKRHLKLRSGPEPTEMVLSVIGVSQGAVPSREIIVEGDNGVQCRPYVTTFPVGKTFLFALNRNEDGYYLSVCGQYSLKLDSPPG